MKTSEIRKKFLKYFNEKQHTIIPSSPLIPANDPTLLFTNAGMVQFKDVFLGQDKRSYTRATSVQRCVRAGGKHNDLENVGYTARHHTFFEMLGNFSFGDYFKKEAIHFAWEFLTQILQLPAEKLWITVFRDDQEAEDIWLRDVKIDPARFSRCGEKDNFWSMGDIGPCGPCTEIFYDHGPEVAGGPPGSPEADGDRYIEIWNLVFMQYERTKDGKLISLPKPSVDTGMGLERLAAVLQGVHSNYEIDLFQNLLQAAQKIIGGDNLKRHSLQVIADHIRSCAFLIADGVVPSNEGRGYVLRRIIRRAIRHGNKLERLEPFFHRLVAPLVQEMGQAYPELTQAQALVEQILLKEEQQFAMTLQQGLKVFEQEVAHLTTNTIPGEIVFKLYDTYGFPPDLTADIARERNLTVDLPSFEQSMAEQRKKSQQSSQFSLADHSQLELQAETQFTGYTELSTKTEVISIISDGKFLQQLESTFKAAVVLKQTPFYAESGGQVGDQGLLQFAGGSFQVFDTKKQGQTVLHWGQLLTGTLRVGDSVTAEVNASTRRATMKNHSATHLLHAALRQILGEQVMQKGSLVDANRLRFDFSHFAPLSRDQVIAIENLVNQKIQANDVVETVVMSPEQAKAKGATALFGEKYGEKVRVLTMSDFSIELCGGTHVQRTGDIGLFKITLDTAVAAGIRRIEAVTGQGALEWLHRQQSTLNLLATTLNTDLETLLTKAEQLVSANKQLEKQVAQLKSKMASSICDHLATQAQRVGDISVVAVEIENADVKILRETLDQLKQKLSKGVIVLAATGDNKAQLVAGVTKDCGNKFHAGQLISYLADQLGGKGGGRPDMAQGGGEAHNLKTALQSVEGWVAQH